MRRPTLLLLLISALVPAPAVAQGWLEPRPGPVQQVTKLRSVVTVQVTDRVASIEVEEWFRNDGRVTAESDYLYPLPGEASFSGFSLFAGDNELRGETMDAAEARRIYEEIVRSRRDPALIELFGHGLLRARVFPIEPGETRRIRLRYTQLLEATGDALHFRYAAGSAHRVPLVFRPDPRPMPLPVPRPGGPRSELESSHDDRGLAAAGADDGRTSLTLTIEDGRAFSGVYSPTHELETRRERGRLVITPRGELRAPISIFLTRAGRPVGLALAAHRPNASEDGWFMLTLAPGDITAARVPRDVTAVVDVSGSMSGEKMEQARQAVLQLLNTLGTQDRIRLISFSSGVSVWREEWAPATPATLQDARAWADALVASGGTNISGALEEALRAPSPAHRLPVVIFLTDGMPTVGETNIDRLLDGVERRRGRSRIFSFGVGYDVNTRLLDAFGAAGGGTTQYVAPEEDVERAVSSLAARISHPVLADLEIGGAPVRITEVHPVRMPDLFAGEELVLFGRYAPLDGRVEGDIVVTGTRYTEDGSERRERIASRVRFATHEPGNEWVARMWAARKIGELERHIRIHGPSDEVIEEIRTTALRHGLVSRYTSHLVLEPGMAFTVGRVGAAPAANSIMLRSGSAVTGLDAVQAAERSRIGREAVTLTEIEQLQLTGVGGAGRRGLAGRVFTERDGVWHDEAHPEDRDVVWIPAFSASYFRVLDALPELRPVFAALDAVVIAGAEISIGVREGQGTGPGSVEVERLIAAFRGVKR
jgi:Ca-activated chloride channel homolog